MRSARWDRRGQRTVGLAGAEWARRVGGGGGDGKGGGGDGGGGDGGGGCWTADGKVQLPASSMHHVEPSEGGEAVQAAGAADEGRASQQPSQGKKLRGLCFRKTRAWTYGLALRPPLFLSLFTGPGRHRGRGPIPGQRALSQPKSKEPRLATGTMIIERGFHCAGRRAAVGLRSATRCAARSSRVTKDCSASRASHPFISCAVHQEHPPGWPDHLSCRLGLDLAAALSRRRRNQDVSLRSSTLTPAAESALTLNCRHGSASKSPGGTERGLSRHGIDQLDDSDELRKMQSDRRKKIGKQAQPKPWPFRRSKRTKVGSGGASVSSKPTMAPGKDVHETRRRANLSGPSQLEMPGSQAGGSRQGGWYSNSFRYDMLDACLLACLLASYIDGLAWTGLAGRWTTAWDHTRLDQNRSTCLSASCIRACSQPLAAGRLASIWQPTSACTYTPAYRSWPACVRWSIGLLFVGRKRSVEIAQARRGGKAMQGPPLPSSLFPSCLVRRRGLLLGFCFGRLRAPPPSPAVR
ncbi:uncharacterized protein PSFLO_02371 [Pseudozyma flocculosa]|uniref:Uncharacterized protein n=1 Tax=Pseudozyma flocculosa TaxID=84751 RepID=A0A5C3EYF7_9BASI|nr:uncharacterized protein PSFLO_02371 [Pseudozyma flocculosa]